MGDIYYKLTETPSIKYCEFADYAYADGSNTKWTPGQHVCINRAVRIESRYLPLPENATGLFYGMMGFETGDCFQRIQTGSCKNMKEMFKSANLNSTIQIANFDSGDTSQVTNMESMFEGASVLRDNTIHCHNGNVSNVTTMRNMFNGVSNLRRIELGNGTPSNVTDFSGMFRDNPNLYRISVIPDTDWSVYRDSPNASGMFENDTRLPYFTPIATGISRANTKYKFGYFTEEWYKYELWFKEFGVWYKQQVKLKIGGDGVTMEVYR